MKNIGRYVWAAVLLAVLMFVLWAGFKGFSSGGKAEATGNHTVCFCHNVNHNPHTICTSNQGQINGHNSHVRNGEDTRGACVEPTATPTPTAQPTVTPTPTPSVCDDDESCEPTPTPTVTPTVTPTEAPHQDNGGGASFAGSSTLAHPPVCTGTAPAEALLLGFSRVDATSVNFRWWKSTDSVDHQDLLFGYAENNLEYSALHLSPDVTEFTVQGLQPNRTVWAQVVSVKDECRSYSNIVDP